MISKYLTGWMWLYLSHYLGICLEEPRKTIQNLNKYRFDMLTAVLCLLEYSSVYSGKI
jgi:hypothetical protein